MVELLATDDRLFAEWDVSKNAQPKPRRSCARILSAHARPRLAQPNDSNTLGGNAATGRKHNVLMAVWTGEIPLDKLHQNLTRL